MSFVPTPVRGDGPCDDCGTRDNIVWSTESVFWNAVIREPYGDRYIDPILCIACFVRRTHIAGYRPTHWNLSPEFHWETVNDRQARVGEGQ